jgi:glyoxylase-like metal-dependent hydrolase (beta-lactamase superfamily II)
VALSEVPEIERLHVADVTLPENHPLAGRPCVVDAFLIRHPEGPVLVDTGVGLGHPVIERLYRPVARSLVDALATVQLGPSDIAVVINSHLHFDHCGQNPLFSGMPIVVQAQEYEAAHEPLYTVPEWVDFPGARLELVDGEREVLSGLWVIPTPGHTPGHQSVLIKAEEGSVVLAGQAAYTVQEFSRPEEGHVAGLEAAWSRDEYLASIFRLRALSPRRVYLSHDPAVWESGDQRM